MLPMTGPSAPLTSSLVNDSGATQGSGAFDEKRWIRSAKHEAEVVAYLDGLYERAKRQRWSFDRQWFVNLSYYFGRQWVTWVQGANPDFARLYEPQAPPWRVRLTVNRIKPTIRREMSKVLKEKPTAFVIPSSTEDDDIAAARAGEAIFEHLWRTMDMASDMWLVQFWRCVTGVGFIKDWWNSTENRIETEIVTPFHLFFASLQEPRLDRQEFIIHQAMKSPEDVKTTYNVEVRPDTTPAGGGVIEQQYLRALNLEAGSVSQVAVKEIWLKPCQRYPRGAMIVWAGSKILYESVDADGNNVWPIASKEYPFTKFDGVPTGRFYGDSSILDLLPLQKEYNRTRSQIIEAKNQMSKPQLLAPRGSIDANKITSEPGLVIFYQPGFERPTPLPLAPLPQYVLQELDRSLQDMADISGQHDVSTGTVPPGVSAASALSFLQEQDDTMIAPIIFSMESGIERIGRHFLQHAQTYWTEAQAVKILGPDNTWEVKKFKGSDLAGNTDLNIQAGSAMPRSLAAKQAFILELAKLQLIAPDQTLRYLEMAETGRMYEETQVDQRQAMRENMKMSDLGLYTPVIPSFQDFAAGAQPTLPGMPTPDPSQGGIPPVPGQQGIQPPPTPIVPVNSWDNHQVHIQEHNNFRKRQEYENLPDYAKVEFERHVALHRAAIGLPPEVNPEQMQQLQMMQQLQGGPQPAPQQGAPAPPPEGLPGPAGGGAMPPPGPSGGPSEPGMMPPPG